MPQEGGATPSRRAALGHAPARGSLEDAGGLRRKKPVFVILNGLFFVKITSRGCGERGDRRREHRRRTQQQRSELPRCEAHLLHLPGHHQPKKSREGTRGSHQAAAGIAGGNPDAEKNPAVMLLLQESPGRQGLLGAGRRLPPQALQRRRQPQHLPRMHEKALSRRVSRDVPGGVMLD